MRRSELMVLVGRSAGRQVGRSAGRQVGRSAGRQVGQAGAAGALEGAADAGGAAVEVFPAQAEEFALAQSGAQSEFEQGGETVPLGCGEELPGLVGGQRVEAAGTGGAGADVAGDVARDLLLADGVLQGGLER
jgi:hypothetical protein